MERTEITLACGVVGEDGADWLPGETRAASAAFAAALVRRGWATPVARPDADAAKSLAADPVVLSVTHAAPPRRRTR